MEVIAAVGAVIAAAVGAILAWFLNRSQHELEMRKLQVELDLQQEKARLEVERLQMELDRKEIYFEREQLEIQNLKAQTEQKDLLLEKVRLEVDQLKAELDRRHIAHEKDRTELEKLRLETEVLRKQLLRLSKDEFWQNLGTRASRLYELQDISLSSALKRSYQEMAETDAIEIDDDLGLRDSRADLDSHQSTSEAGSRDKEGVEDLEIGLAEDDIPGLGDSKFGPTTLRRAREMLDSARKDLLDALEEVFFMFDIQNYSGWVDDAHNLLWNIERHFSAPIAIARSEGEAIIRKAREANASFDLSKYDERLSTAGYDLVRKIVMSITPHILSKDECIDKLFEYPDNVVVPFLITKYHSEVASPTYEDIQSMLFEKGFGIEILPIIEKNIMYGPPSIQWRNAVSRAEGILGDISVWYRGIRGISYEEDVEEYRKHEARWRSL